MAPIVRESLVFYRDVLKDLLEGGGNHPTDQAEWEEKFRQINDILNDDNGTEE